MSFETEDRERLERIEHHLSHILEQQEKLMAEVDDLNQAEADVAAAVQANTDAVTANTAAVTALKASVDAEIPAINACIAGLRQNGGSGLGPAECEAMAQNLEARVTALKAATLAVAASTAVASGTQAEVDTETQSVQAPPPAKPAN